MKARKNVETIYVFGKAGYFRLSRGLCSSMMIVTADIIRMIPMPMLSVKASLKTNILTDTAVSGSIAPRTDVLVEPMRFTASISERLDMMVGMMANIIRLRAVCPFCIGWKLLVDVMSRSRNKLLNRKT